MSSLSEKNITQNIESSISIKPAFCNCCHQLKPCAHFSYTESYLDSRLNDINFCPSCLNKIAQFAQSKLS